MRRACTPSFPQTGVPRQAIHPRRPRSPASASATHLPRPASKPLIAAHRAPAARADSLRTRPEAAAAARSHSHSPSHSPSHSHSHSHSHSGSGRLPPTIAHPRTAGTARSEPGRRFTAFRTTESAGTLAVGSSAFRTRAPARLDPLPIRTIRLTTGARLPSEFRPSLARTCRAPVPSALTELGSTALAFAVSDSVPTRRAFRTIHRGRGTFARTGGSTGLHGVRAAPPGSAVSGTGSLAQAPALTLTLTLTLTQALALATPHFAAGLVELLFGHRTVPVPIEGRERHPRSARTLRSLAALVSGPRSGRLRDRVPTAQGDSRDERGDEDSSVHGDSLFCFGNSRRLAPASVPRFVLLIVAFFPPGPTTADRSCCP